MAIPESQLDTWSRQGATASSRTTYASVKTVLEDGEAPYAIKSPTIFLQGSYENDTNVARDSDVDVVAAIDSTFSHDANTLPNDQHQAFQRAYPDAASYTYQDYKRDVTAWLTRKFGSGVTAGRKAIYIPASSNRRDCDVLAATEYRYYYQFISSDNQRYASGICFYLPDGTQVVNFPKQHSDNCTVKHQATSSWFKPTVRIYKNMRNYLVERNQLQDGIAPSYFIEGMLYNVPNDKFGSSWESTFIATYNFLVNADRSTFKCANSIHPLLGSSPVTWPSVNCQAYLDALRLNWNNWR